VERASTVMAKAYPWLVATAIASVALVPAQMSAGLSSAIGLLLAGLLAVSGMSAHVRTDFWTRVLLVSAAAAIAWFTFTSLRAANPAVSFVGMLGQHNGTALIVMGAAWFLAGVFVASQRAMRLTTWFVAIAGGVFSLAAFAEMAMSGAQRVQGFAAGFFENSSSLGQFLGVAALASAAWALTESHSARRWLAWSLGAIAVVATLATSSRTGLLALAAGVALAWLAMSLPRSTRVTNWLAASVAAAPFVITGVLVAASTSRLGAAARVAVATLGTDRDAIWEAAAHAVGRAPLLGTGLQQFSAWITWSTAGGTPTTDPHNVVLALLLGGGVVGLALAAVAWTAVVFLVVRTARNAASWPVALVAVTPIALTISSLVSWTTPAALTAAAALSGAAVGVGLARESAPKLAKASKKAAAAAAAQSTPSAWDGIARWGVAFVGVSSLIAGVIVLWSLPAQFAFVSSPAPDRLAGLYERWPDPAFASVAIRSLTQSAAAGDPAAVAALDSLIERSGRDAAWRVDLTGAQLLAVQTLTGSDPSGFERFEAIAQQGSVADPQSGLWDALRALEANRLGLTDEARRYARLALAFELDAETRATLEQIAGE